MRAMRAIMDQNPKRIKPNPTKIEPNPKPNQAESSQKQVESKSKAKSKPNPAGSKSNPKQNLIKSRKSRKSIAIPSNSNPRTSVAPRTSQARACRPRPLPARLGQLAAARAGCAPRPSGARAGLGTPEVLVSIDFDFNLDFLGSSYSFVIDFLGSPRISIRISSRISIRV